MPTPKKLRDARQKGQVCSSKDIVSTAILIVLFAVLGWMGIALVDDASMLVALVIGIAANTAQIGFLFTLEPIIPKLEKLNPVEGAKKSLVGSSRGRSTLRRRPCPTLRVIDGDWRVLV